MKKKVLLLLIQIMVVTLALVLTVTTYAWYSAQHTVSITETSVTASAGANASINSESSDDYADYKGQTGQGIAGTATADDMPYVAEKTVNISFSPNIDVSALTMGITSMEVYNPSTKAWASSSDEVIGYFTWRAEIDGVEYKPDGNGFAVMVDEPAEGESPYYLVHKNDGAINIVFKLIFLSEEEYVKRSSPSYEPDPDDAFAYSGIENMGCKFRCKFEIGIDDVPATPEPEPEPGATE